jgi:sulfate/thiosulfate transport system substrate-binding protein
MMRNKLVQRLILGAIIACGWTGVSAIAGQSLLNVSYDPTRELYKEINPLFVAEWKKKSGEDVEIQSSHGGSGSQARAVIEGLDADVVTLALANDIDAIALKTGKIPANWQTRLPHNSSPYTSTIVFLVRKGNPKNIHDWDDLARPGIGVVTPNPKTGGGARWNYLAAWGYGLKKFKNDENKTQDFVRAIYKNAPVLDSGARGSTMTFTKREIGDVLITWENEAYLAIKEYGSDKFEVIAPSLSILAEPAVSLVDGNVDKKGTRKVAQAYLEFLYQPLAQKIIAKNFYRPARPEFADPDQLKQFPKIQLITIDKTFGGWAEAQKKHFADGTIFDQILK